MLDIHNKSGILAEYRDLYNDSKYDEVIRKFGEQIDVEPNNPLILNIVGATYQKLNKLSLAKEYFTKAAELDPSVAEVFFNLGNIEYSQKSYQDAFDNYNKALNNNFVSAIVLVQMGRCLVGLNHLSDAKALYDNALEIDPHCSQAYIELAELKSIENEPEETIEYFYKALEINPNSALCLLRLAKYFSRLDQPKMALNFIQKALNLGAKDTDLFFEQAAILKKIGFPEESVFILKNILETDNQNSKAFDMIGSNLLSLGIADEAIERFCDSIYLEPEGGDSYQNLGTALSSVGRFKDAEECFIKASELLGESSNLHCEMGKMYFKTGDVKTALAEYNLSSTLNRKSIAPLIGKFELSGFCPELRSDTLFKEISFHMTEQNSDIDIFCVHEDLYDTESIALVSFGNSKSSLYVQSLMDGHPEISSLPGYYFKTWFEEKTWPIFNPELSNSNWRKILANDICRHFEPMFDASSEKAVLGISDHGTSSAGEMGFNNLGKDGSKVFSLNMDLFKEKFLELLLPIDQLNQKKCFELVHKAFDLAYRAESNENFTGNRILHNFHEPNLDAYLKFLSYYPKSRILNLIQNPIQLVEDWIQTGFSQLTGKDCQKDSQVLSTVIDKIAQLLLTFNNPLNTICNVGGVKLETLVNNPKETIPRIAEWLEICEDKSLFNSSFLNEQFLERTQTNSKLNELYYTADKKVSDRVLGAKDKQVLETLFWPLMSSFQYTQVDDVQFEKNLQKIRPLLDKPLQFEQDFHAKIGDKTVSVELTDSYQALHRHLINAWELLDKNKTYPNLIKTILN